MGSQELANRVRNRSDYFARRKIRHLVKRSVSAAILWLAFHMWGLAGLVPVFFGAAWAVITIRLEISSKNL